jgi:hypothetical protein
MMTLEMNDELLLVMLFFGLRRLLGSLVFSGTSKALPSPKAGAEKADMEVVGPVTVEPLLLSLASCEARPSLGCSAMSGESVAAEVSL